jgi:hypothetical protein
VNIKSYIGKDKTHEQILLSRKLEKIAGRSRLTIMSKAIKGGKTVSLLSSKGNAVAFAGVLSEKQGGEYYIMEAIASATAKEVPVAQTKKVAQVKCL